MECEVLFHQEHSGPLMKTLHDWMEAQLAERKTEPNSGWGKVIRYMLRHWMPLTLFFREPGAPVDNKLVERILKKAILHRNWVGMRIRSAWVRPEASLNAAACFVVATSTFKRT